MVSDKEKKLEQIVAEKHRAGKVGSTAAFPYLWGRCRRSYTDRDI